MFFGLLVPMYNFSMLENMRNKVDQGLTKCAEFLDSFIFPNSEEFNEMRLGREMNHAVIEIPGDVVPTEIEDIQAFCMFFVAGFFVAQAIEERVFPGPSFTRNISSLERLAEEAAKSSADLEADQNLINKHATVSRSSSPNHELHDQPSSIRIVRSESSVAIEETDAILSSGMFHTISSETMIDGLNTPSPSPKNRRPEEDWVVVSRADRTSKKN
jgi:hypothetical protein